MTGNLKSRLITGSVLTAGLIGVLFWLPPHATVWVLTALVLIGAWEWSGFFRVANAFWRALYVAAIAACMLFAWRIAGTSSGLRTVLAVAVAWWIAAFGWVVIAPRRVAPWSAALAGVFVLVPAWLALSRLRLDTIRGAEWVLFAFVLVWMADIGGYVFGHRFGRLRLAPAVSPGKTWEGAIGGFVLSAAVAVAGSFWFEVPLARFLPLCLGVVAFSIVGDLTESLLKRYAGVKDSGTLFPGHGGVMDRIDSITAAAPVLLFGLTMLGALR